MPTIKSVHWGNLPYVISKVAQVVHVVMVTGFPRAAKEAIPNTQSLFNSLFMLHLLLYNYPKQTTLPNLQLLSEETIEGHGCRKAHKIWELLMATVYTNLRYVFLGLMFSPFFNLTRCEMSMFHSPLKTSWTFLPPVLIYDFELTVVLLKLQFHKPHSVFSIISAIRFQKYAILTKCREYYVH